MTGNPIEIKDLTRILLVDDDAALREATGITLRKNNYLVSTADTVAKASEMLKSRKFDLLISSVRLSDGTALDLLEPAQLEHHKTSVIILTAHGLIENAIEAMRRGACQYIVRPFKIEELLIQIEHALKNRRIRQELEILRQEITWKYGFDSLVGISSAMQKLKTLAVRISATDASVLISGEAGTGKELLAKTIHYHSGRRKNKFVPVDCTSIPESLLESELFGDCGRAAAAAFGNPKGRFEEATGGTIFLDEIAAVPRPLQKKILQAMQNSRIFPVGSADPVKIDTRVIAATGQDPDALARDGHFHNDLYRRLNVVPLHIPPLRERINDIAALIEHFIRIENASKVRDRISISAEAMEKLLSHSWPGNVHELETTVKRAMTMSRNGQITDSDIMFLNADRQPAHAFGRSGLAAPVADGTLEESLKLRIEATLHATNWNYTKTAIKLGIGRTTLWRKIKKYDIRKIDRTRETVTR
ncbi:MAG: sigma-54-dependent Fis family transcriptional regulator [Candidatus Zixiibacteriota bacterium]|nr:MAG: sigma-54-dependent Fis family transcriptional regulator [candidate division Zixibacteria bacterium]